MAIIRAVIALGKSLQIKITAEGVETETQLSLLQAESCDQVQGYLLGKPMAKEDLSTFSKARRPAAPALQAETQPPKPRNRARSAFRGSLPPRSG